MAAGTHSLSTPKSTERFRTSRTGWLPPCVGSGSGRFFLLISFSFPSGGALGGTAAGGACGADYMTAANPETMGVMTSASQAFRDFSFTPRGPRILAVVLMVLAAVGAVAILASGSLHAWPACLPLVLVGYAAWLMFWLPR